MTKYEYAKLNLNNDKDVDWRQHKFETAQTGELFMEGHYGLMGILDELGAAGWQAFNKTHRTIWFIRAAPKEVTVGRNEDTSNLFDDSGIVELGEAQKEPEESNDQTSFYIQFSLADHYKFIHILQATREASGVLAKNMQFQNYGKHKQYLSAPLHTREEILNEVINKSKNPDVLLQNLRTLYEDPQFKNLEVSTN